jgi:hypothetical protein
MTATGDVLLASVHARLAGDVSITPPNGWNLIRRDSSTTDYSSLTQALYYKVAGPSEPASYSWSWSTTATAAGASSISRHRQRDANRFTQRRFHAPELSPSRLR